VKAVGVGIAIAECRDSGVGSDVMFDRGVSGPSVGISEGGVSPSADEDGDRGDSRTMPRAWAFWSCS
jgi:hypothetical protein